MRAYYLNIVLAILTIAECQVLRNEDSSYATSVFSTNENSRFYGEKLLTKNSATLDACQYLCLKHLKCTAVNYNEKCELIGKVTHTKVEEGWLASQTSVDTNVVSFFYKLFLYRVSQEKVYMSGMSPWM